MRRLLVTAGLTATALVGSAAPALAHGIGARGDLPIPLWWALYGAVAVLVFSFVALIRLWPESRLEGGPAGVPVDGVGRAADLVRPVTRLLGTLLFLVIVMSALANSDLPAYVLFVGFWVGVPIVSAILGDVWSLLNPFAALADLFGGADVGIRDDGWLDRAGLYPAAIMLLGFGWLELAHPDPANPNVVLGYLVLYALVLIVGGLVWGRRFIDQADAFGVYFGLIGRMGVFQRDAEGQLRLRAPLAGLSAVAPRKGTAAVVLVALGVTSFDGLGRTAVWEQLMGTRTGWATVPLNTIGVLVMVGVAVLAYELAMQYAEKAVGEPQDELVERFAHSLVPIALAYAVAHYFSLLVLDGGQLLVALASDPFERGWDLFGTAGNAIDFTAVSTSTIAIVQVASITLGHVAGVVLAHDRAVARYPVDVATRSQYPLLGAMVLYTVGGLVLLLGA